LINAPPTFFSVIHSKICIYHYSNGLSFLLGFKITYNSYLYIWLSKAFIDKSSCNQVIEAIIAQLILLYTGSPIDDCKKDITPITWVQTDDYFQSSQFFTERKSCQLILIGTETHFKKQDFA
jgi:hypothetical protein